MELKRNAFKHAIAEGKLQIGLWSSLASNISTEIIANSGFDWILIDTEHTPNEVPGVMSQLQAMVGGTATPIVRPAWNDAVLFKRLLDIGSQSLLVPYVQNAEEAQRAVDQTRYPPVGIRGVAASTRAGAYGRIKDYLKTAATEICLIAQVETPSAMDELEKIAEVEGVDGVFIGPSDLGAAMGHIGQPGNPEVQAALKDAVDRLKAVGKPAGILTVNEEEAKRYVDWGYTFVAVGIDLSLLAKAADALAARFKG